MSYPSKKIIEKATIRLRKQRAQVVQSNPFFGSLLLKQKLVPSVDIQTLATNGKELFFNPEYVLDQRPEYLQFDCAHEALHPGFAHHTRRGNRRFDWWNEACDLAINPILVEAGFHMPPDALLRDDMRGEGAEHIYKTLAGERQQDPEGPDDNASPPPMPQPIPDDDGQPDDQQSDAGDAGDDPSDDGSTGDGSGDDQSQDGSEGQPGDGDQPGDSQVPSFGGTGAVLDAPVKDEAERQAEENEWKVAAIQAANFAAAQGGDMPGDLVRQLDALVKPIANWRELLRRYMDQFAKADYTWAKGNRRFLGQGMYLPSLQSEQLPPILFVVDASCSMPADSLNQAAGELQSIIDELQPEFVDVIVHDTDVRGEAQRFEPGDDLDIDVRAGGGTKFSPVCEWIDQADENYAVVVWFTDLEPFDWDDCAEPDVPLIWIDWLARDNADAPFGDEIIALEDDWS